MKAIICTKYGPPEVLQIRDVSKPVPKDNEVCIKVRATTVTVADSRIRSFRVPAAAWIPARLVLGITKPKKAILGVELSGEIEAIGKNVKAFKPGEEVFAATLFNFGAYAEYACVPEDAVAIKPGNISHEEAAAIPVGACTALSYLKAGSTKSGQKILVYGASGSVGTYAVQLAKYFGAEVTGVCSKSNFELVRSIGADKVVDYKEPDFVKKLDQYDVVFLAIDKLPFEICETLLKEDGVYLNITQPVKSLSMLWTSLTTKKKILVGQSVPNKGKELTFLKQLVESGAIKPVIDRFYRMEEIVEAHRYVDQGHKKGNVVITV